MTEAAEDVSKAMEDNNNNGTIKSKDEKEDKNNNNNGGTFKSNDGKEESNNNGGGAIKSNDHRPPQDSNLLNQNQNQRKNNRIQVSNTKKPLFFYLNLAKRYLKQHDEVELSALGMAIPTVVIIAEILKRNGIATDQKVMISTVGNNDESNGRFVRKARIEIILEKTKNTAATNQMLSGNSK
ncbi:OLC1v1019816C1 [Oldenlandia corymbosa var. corymbosa]|uniref:OLC1v1019816C1 n=1 Tax=Oldenlandia corymbosa var. corymbosa TaxID=529605 RepID=A0AAV1EF05_OLDCO|nr:OLC1v1019816C1 [Oldenlandia corymbosa var. corymbosa]